MVSQKEVRYTVTEQEEQKEIIYDPGEPAEPEQPEFELTREEKRWVALGALKSALLIGSVYLIGGVLLIGLMLLVWT